MPGHMAILLLSYGGLGGDLTELCLVLKGCCRQEASVGVRKSTQLRVLSHLKVCKERAQRNESLPISMSSPIMCNHVTLVKKKKRDFKTLCHSFTLTFGALPRNRLHPSASSLHTPSSLNTQLTATHTPHFPVPFLEVYKHYSKSQNYFSLLYRKFTPSKCSLALPDPTELFPPCLSSLG